MKVLVTGGAGYVGSHACQALAQKGITPVTVDNLTRGFSKSVLWGPLYETDIRDTEKISKIIKDEKIDTVFHFAAFAYVGESTTDPLSYYENNVIGSLSLLQAMKNSGARKIIFSSTCATYGLIEKNPIDESFPQYPINPYGRSKLMVELILKDFVKAHNFSVVSLRYFNAAGADPLGNIGENHSPETHLVPLAIEAAHNGRIFNIFGNDYSTSDGTCVRDYIHVCDLAEAHILAMKYIDTKSGFECFNLGTGEGYSVKNIISKVEEITNKKINIEISSRRIGDPDTLISSGEKSKEILKWMPKHSSIKEIIETANSWYLSRK